MCESLQLKYSRSRKLLIYKKMVTNVGWQCMTEHLWKALSLGEKQTSSEQLVIWLWLHVSAVCVNVCGLSHHYVTAHFCRWSSCFLEHFVVSIREFRSLTCSNRSSRSFVPNTTLLYFWFSYHITSCSPSPRPLLKRSCRINIRAFSTYFNLWW